MPSYSKVPPMHFMLHMHTHAGVLLALPLGEDLGDLPAPVGRNRRPGLAGAEGRTAVSTTAEVRLQAGGLQVSGWPLLLPL